MSVTTPINIGMHIHEVTKPPSPEQQRVRQLKQQLDQARLQQQCLTALNIGRQAIGKKKPTVLPQWVDVLPD